MNNERFDPEKMLGRLTALEIICISFIRQQLSTPEARRILAESVRGTAADIPVGGLSSSFLDGFKDGITDFATKLESYEF